MGVTDGDTIKVLDGWFVEHKIRLQCIDAPEKSMAFGQRAKQALASLVAGKNVSVKVLDLKANAASLRAHEFLLQRTRAQEVRTEGQDASPPYQTGSHQAHDRKQSVR